MENHNQIGRSVRFLLRRLAQNAVSLRTIISSVGFFDVQFVHLPRPRVRSVDFKNWPIEKFDDSEFKNNYFVIEKKHVVESM